MKRLFMLMALGLMLVAAMALSGVAQAASPSAKCKQEAESLTGSTLTGYNIVVGNDRKNDDFTGKATAGTDVFCGRGGNDSITTLDAGDIFIGGDGNDRIGTNNGTFYGGAGDDSVSYNRYLFYGGNGIDRVTAENHDSFNGGAGDDYVYDNVAYFHGGDGIDTVAFGSPAVDGP